MVAETCERALVMYCGEVIERADIRSLFEQPRHPYSRGLLDSIPKLREDKLKELPIIPGMVPDLLHLPPGCRFADRCSRVTDECRMTRPQIDAERAEGNDVACLRPLD